MTAPNPNALDIASQATAAQTEVAYRVPQSSAPNKFVLEAQQLPAKETEIVKAAARFYDVGKSLMFEANISQILRLQHERIVKLVIGQMAETRRAWVNLSAQDASGLGAKVSVERGWLEIEQLGNLIYAKATPKLMGKLAERYPIVFSYETGPDGVLARKRLSIGGDLDKSRSFVPKDK